MVQSEKTARSALVTWSRTSSQVRPSTAGLLDTWPPCLTVCVKGEPLGMRVRQPLEENGIDQRKDRRIDANGQREREDGGQREGWCAPEDAARVADVQPRCLDESKR